MSRAIKFRVWDSVTKEWQSQYLLSPEGLLCVQAWAGTPAHLELEYLPDRERNVVEQFTGLLDKEGKEIYEGDILRRDYRGSIEQYEPDGEWIGWSEAEFDNYFLYEVVYSASTFTINCNEYSILLNGFAVRKVFNSDLTSSTNKSADENLSPLGASFDGRHTYGSFGHVASELVLVGNVHENPDLLKARQS